MVLYARKITADLLTEKAKGEILRLFCRYFGRSGGHADWCFKQDMVVTKIISAKIAQKQHPAD